MKNIILLLLVVFSTACYAQNYNCIKSSEKQYFINSNGYLRGMRIDSVVVHAGDTTYYPFKIERSYPDTSNASWLGSHILQQANGSFLFYNRWNDTVTIKTQAQIGESWIFYKDTSARYYKATVLSIDTMTVMGLVDSVKNIMLTSYTGSSINTADTINGFRIALSKQHGFVQIFDLYTFPYRDTNASAYTPLFDWYLDIICSPMFTTLPVYGHVTRANSTFNRTAYHNPTQIEIYNFNVGDAFYTVGSSTDPYGQGSMIYDSVISKTMPDPYHVQYQYYEKSLISNYHPGGSTDYYSVGSSGFIADTSVLTGPVKMPEELGTFDTVHYFIPGDTSHCFVSNYYASDVPVLFEGCNYRQVYKVGFSKLSSAGFVPPGPDDIGCHSSSTTDMLFSIKGGSYCGSYPSIPTAVADINKPAACRIYPNPATDQLTISAPDKIISVAISNLVGQAVYTGDYNSQTVKINVGSLPTGMYLVRINGSQPYRFIKE